MRLRGTVGTVSKVAEVSPRRPSAASVASLPMSRTASSVEAHNERHWGGSGQLMGRECGCRMEDRLHIFRGTFSGLSQGKALE